MTDTKREAIFPAGRHALYDAHRYSAAIRSRDLLFVSGQVGSRTDGSPEPDFERQVQLAFDNLAAILDAAGCGFADIVDVTTFHNNPEAQLGTVIAVRERVVGGAPYPNWTAVGVTWRAFRSSPDPRATELIRMRSASQRRRLAAQARTFGIGGTSDASHRQPYAL